MIDYVAAVERESARLLDLVTRSALDAAVPSCPGWTVADLTWHVAEVQHAWAAIVADLLLDRARVPELKRPPDDLLVAVLSDKSQALVEAVRSHDPSAECWSWDPAGRSVGWVRRRQAHEALIHRIDAELAVGATHISVDQELASDGVDEILTLFMDASDLPDWSRFAAMKHIVEIRLVEPAKSWFAELGRFQGNSPVSGKTYDEEALRLVEPQAADTTIQGGADAVDRWLWGRGPLAALDVTGDVDRASWVRAAASHATQ